MIPSSQEQLETYRIEKEIGQGGFSRVYLGRDQSTGEKVAVKVISKKAASIKAVNMELNIQKKFSSKYIVNMYQMTETPTDIILAMEYVDGGELFDAIVNAGNLTEKEAANVIQQVFFGLKILHENNIIHRDLKPENILLTKDESGNTAVKLCDFGLATMLDNSEEMKRYCGTEGYAAPEIMQNIPYDASIDIWSLGVILYIMLCGFKPFDAEEPYELYEQITTANYEFFSPEWDTISSDARDLVYRMMQVDPKKRITIDQALEHPWIKGNAPDIKLDCVQTHLTKFVSKRRLRRAMMKMKTAAAFEAFLDKK